MTIEINGPSSTEHASVFISYRHVDYDSGVADRLFSLLTEHGIKAWYDRLIPKGKDWRDAIVEKLSHARLMVILLSEAALESDEIKKELAVASQYDVKLVTVRLEDVEPREAFAYELSGSQWLDLFDADDKRLAELVNGLQTQLERQQDVAQRLDNESRPSRQRRSSKPGRALRNGPLLFGGFLVISAVQLLLFDRINGSADTIPLLWKALGVSVFSPVLLLNTLSGGIQKTEFLILISATLNSVLLIAIGGFLLRTSRNWILRWHAAKRAVAGRK